MDFLPILQGSHLKITGTTDTQIYAICPWHEDNSPSLSIKREGGAWTCHGQCKSSGSGAQLLAKLGLPPLGENGASPPGPSPLGTIVATYDYTDEQGTLLSQAVRFAPKTFRQRQPDGTGGWVWNVEGVRRVPYCLHHLHHVEMVVIVEGEKDADRLWALEIAATTNPGGAKNWRDEYATALRTLGVKEVVILPDHDKVGREHADTVAISCRRAGLRVTIVALPGLDEHGDVSDWFDAGHTVAELDTLIEETPEFDGLPTTGPWANIPTVAEFMAEGDPVLVWLIENQLARECLTKWASPHGIGKSLVAHAYAVQLARQGHRVLLLDRDNPPREVKRRLNRWDMAGLTKTLRVRTSYEVPPLTDREAWKSFPADAFDLVIVDSWDAFTEGVGEKDSAKPSLAFKVLRELAHRPNGPAVLVLANTVKSGAHARGSGVIDDRGDINYEIRDATGFTPTGKKPWHMELAPQGAADYGARAERRKQRETYRLAFVNGKFRIGVEPEPFVIGLDLSHEPWTVRDETAAMWKMQEVEKEATAAQRETAVQELFEAVQKLTAAGGAALTSGLAETFLTQRGLSRAQARTLIADSNAPWILAPGTGPGKDPKVLRPWPGGPPNSAGPPPGPKIKWRRNYWCRLTDRPSRSF